MRGRDRWRLLVDQPLVQGFAKEELALGDLEARRSACELDHATPCCLGHANVIGGGVHSKKIFRSGG